MTLDEWTDEVARMTPRQRQAMAIYGQATSSATAIEMSGLSISPNCAARWLECITSGGGGHTDAVEELAEVHPG